jgi:hypothetical protein
MMAISCIFIIFILLIITIIIFFEKTNKKINESFTTPTAVNFPSDNNLDGKPFFVGNNNNNSLPPEEPIVKSSGEFEFKKMKLLYDGVWGEKCYLDERGFQKCDWSDKNRQFSKYGTDKFLIVPEIKIEMGESIISPLGCSKSSYKKLNNYSFLQKPTIEDVFGFVPQNNELDIKLPPPRLSTF